MELATEKLEAEPISDEAAADFVDFLEKREDYLDSGLGAFHTDDHSNW